MKRVEIENSIQLLLQSLTVLEQRKEFLQKIYIILDSEFKYEYYTIDGIPINYSKLEEVDYNKIYHTDKHISNEEKLEDIKNLITNNLFFKYRYSIFDKILIKKNNYTEEISNDVFGFGCEHITSSFDINIPESLL